MVGCKTRSGTSGVRDQAPSGEDANAALDCTFPIPYQAGDNFRVRATLANGQLSNISGAFTKDNQTAQPRSIPAGKNANPDELTDMWDKKLADQKSGDKMIRDYEKQNFKLDLKEYQCFDVSGIGPRARDFLCFHSSGKVSDGQAYWVSDFRYEHDYNVLNIMGSSCYAAN